MNKYTDMNIDGTTDDDIMRELTNGLATNAKLKSLVLNRQRDKMMSATTADDYLRKLLCNTTSIESIYNSNHTLVRIMVGCRHSIFLTECIETQ